METMRSRIEAATRDIRHHVGHHDRPFEGSSIGQLEHLAQLAHLLPDQPLIGEVGFNLGYSTAAFLIGNPSAHVVSFDIGGSDVERAKGKIDGMFHLRHTLITGDSRVTVPRYRRTNPRNRFDLVFIDGGHTYALAKADVLNMRALAHSKTKIVMDDLVPLRPWGFWPSFVWKELKLRLFIQEHERYTDLFGWRRRAWAVGSYI